MRPLDLDGRGGLGGGVDNFFAAGVWMLLLCGSSMADDRHSQAWARAFIKQHIVQFAGIPGPRDCLVQAKHLSETNIGGQFPETEGPPP